VSRELQQAASPDADVIEVDPDERAMDRWATIRLIDLAAGDSAQSRKMLTEELREVAASLAGPSPSPAERMLAEVAALDWFTLRTFEARHAAGIADKSLRLATSDPAHKRIDRAHRRLLASLRTLATLRRLALPAVQINLARQQVNIAGGHPGTSTGDHLI
jgi:hypothetical protein